MANEHVAAGVNETNRNKTVAASAAAGPAQTARTAAAAVTVASAYSSNGKTGGP